MHALTFISLANFTIDLPCGARPRVLVPVPYSEIGFARYDGCTSDCKVQTVHRINENQLARTF